eukprot:81807_1
MVDTLPAMSTAKNVSPPIKNSHEIWNSLTITTNSPTPNPTARPIGRPPDLLSASRSNLFCTSSANLLSKKTSKNSTLASHKPTTNRKSSNGHSNSRGDAFRRKIFDLPSLSSFSESDSSSTVSTGDVSPTTPTQITSPPSVSGCHETAKRKNRNQSLTVRKVRPPFAFKSKSLPSPTSPALLIAEQPKSKSNSRLLELSPKPTCGSQWRLRDMLWSLDDDAPPEPASSLFRIDDKILARALCYLTLSDITKCARTNTRLLACVRLAFAQLTCAGFKVANFRLMLSELPRRCPCVSTIVVDVRYSSKRHIQELFLHGYKILRGVVGSVPSGVIARMSFAYPRLAALNQAVQTTADLAAISRLCWNLKELTLFKAQHVKSVGGIDEVINNCRNLERFNLYGIDVKISVLVNLRKLAHLTHLQLRLANLNNDEVKVMAAVCSQLVELDIMENPEVTSRGVKFLAVRMHDLVVLNVGSTGVRRDVTKLFATPKVFPKLRRLTVPADVQMESQAVVNRRSHFCAVMSG